ncbi:SdpI family protein [Anaerotignum faecicola]|nr:SdpI family protein [Anaerotignum faecicola]
MGFWIFMLLMDLLIPFTMIGFGKRFMEKTPKKINAVFGYRTAMSMKNKDTWSFAHKYCGNIWYTCGLIFVPVTIFVMALLLGKTEDTVGSIGGILCGIQMIPFIGSFFSTEKALNKTFDKAGKRR